MKNKRDTSSSNSNGTENDFVPPIFSSDVIPHPASESRTEIKINLV